MKKYDNLLSNAAGEFSIEQGQSETEEQYKTRIIYSIAGRMALASLWDVVDEGNISIIHFKNRIHNIFDSYKALYPELAATLPVDGSGPANDIYDICLRTGILYHEPNRIAMSAKSEVSSGGVLFTRGYPVGTRQSVSGIGTYSLSKKTETADARGWFMLDDKSLSDNWRNVIDGVTWNRLRSDGRTEYLRMDPPFTRGYWLNGPDKTGRISLLRTGVEGTQLYYFYRWSGTTIEVSQIAAWRTEELEYRQLANACLAYNGSLPRTKYVFDGDIVRVSFGYLPPPTELNIWKLYSWPESMINLPQDFNRICSKSVFCPLKGIMETRGFVFEEG